MGMGRADEDDEVEVEGVADAFEDAHQSDDDGDYDANAEPEESDDDEEDGGIMSPSKIALAKAEKARLREQKKMQRAELEKMRLEREEKEAAERELSMTTGTSFAGFSGRELRGLEEELAAERLKSLSAQQKAESAERAARADRQARVMARPLAAQWRRAGARVRRRVRRSAASTPPDAADASDCTIEREQRYCSSRMITSFVIINLFDKILRTRGLSNKIIHMPRKPTKRPTP